MNIPTQLEQLRPDLEILRVGPDSFRLFDAQTGAHFELGVRERYLLGLLPVCKTVSEMAAACGQKFGHATTEREIREFLEQLRRHALLEGSARVLPAADETIPHRSAFPLQLRGSAVNVFFDVLTLLFGWLLHPIWLLAIVPACLIEAALLFEHGDRLFYELKRAHHDIPLPLLFAAGYTQVVLLLNLPMALLAGICCRKFGGRVRSFGLTWGNWLLPTVSFFIDTGDSAAGMSARGRWTQIALGVVAPLALGALYSICWGASSRVHDGHQLWLVMILPCLIVAICQCNPFSTSGSAHWALACAVDDWRLHGRAIEETIAWFWGRTSPEPLSRRERRWLRAYGAAHYFFRCLADIAMLAGAGYLVATTFGAAGAAALLALICWWNRSHLAPLWRMPGQAWSEFSASWRPARGR